MKEENRLILKYIGERLRTFRLDSGISREYAANILGITPRTLASYERGEREITVPKLRDLAIAYSTTFTNLTDYQNVLDRIY